MIDPRRAQGLLKALRFAKENLRDSLKENSDWHATPYHTEEAEAYDNFESDYGLPENIDVLRPSRRLLPPTRKWSQRCHPERRRRFFCAAAVEGPLCLAAICR
jgi:hypothetical protein